MTRLVDPSHRPRIPDLAPTRPDFARARLLLELDRRIFDLIFVENLSQSASARALGIERSTLTRRLHRILQRLRSPESDLIVDPNFPIPQTHRTIATLHHIAGLSVRQIVSRLDLSFHTVRTTLADVQSRCDAFRTLQRKLSRTLASLP
jgi:DNA-directed RNA polymerase specialized sigma24 family protein